MSDGPKPIVCVEHAATLPELELEPDELDEELPELPDEALELAEDEPLVLAELPDVELVLLVVELDADAPPAPPSPELELDEEPELVVLAEEPPPVEDELVASVDPPEAWLPVPPQPTAPAETAIAAKRKLRIICSLPRRALSRGADAAGRWRRCNRARGRFGRARELREDKGVKPK